MKKVFFLIYKQRKIIKPVAVVRLQYFASWLLNTKSGISRSSLTRIALIFWTFSQKNAKSVVAKPSIDKQKKTEEFLLFIR